MTKESHYQSQAASAAITILAVLGVAAIAPASGQAAEPIKALYITGGGWHDYPEQEGILTKGLGERVDIDWTIEKEAGDRSGFWYDRFDKEDWSKEFDVVVYNFCITDIPQVERVEGVVQEHVDSGIHFRAEVYTYPNANSGIFFHTQWQPGGWPSAGYEAQVNATQGDRIKTGSVYGVANLMDNAPHDDREWFMYEIIVKDDRIVLKVDGETVKDYTEPADVEGSRRLSSGTFALQAHDPGSRIYYRNIYVRPLRVLEAVRNECRKQAL